MDVYGRYSDKKARAYAYCRDLMLKYEARAYAYCRDLMLKYDGYLMLKYDGYVMLKYDGYDFRIIGYNTFMFTCGFMFRDPATDELTFAYITPTYNYCSPIA